jgi:hypothetical protein
VQKLKVLLCIFKKYIVIDTYRAVMVAWRGNVLWILSFVARFTQHDFPVLEEWVQEENPEQECMIEARKHEMSRNMQETPKRVVPIMKGNTRASSSANDI